MIPQRLILQNFKGIRAGLGLEQIDLDLTNLPEGLIAISGHNGAGKSTIMDSLTPYRVQPFKMKDSTSWKVGEFSYYDQVAGEGKKELWWSMSGRSFKSLILIDASRRKQECYLHEQINGQWVPVEGCTGKTKEYDAAVEAILGSTSLFFSSAYRAQSARNLSDYMRSEIVGILSELLNVGHIREQGVKCGKVVAALSHEINLVRTRLADIAADAASIGGLEKSIEEQAVGISDRRTLLDAVRQELTCLQADIVGMKERRAAAESESARLQNLQNQLASERNRLEEAKNNLKKSAAGFEQRIASLQASHNRFVADLEAKVARANKIVSGAEQVRQAVIDEAELVSLIEKNTAHLESFRSKCDETKAEIANTTASLRGLRVDIHNAEAAVSRLEGLDCHGDGSGWLNPDCKLIADAVGHRDRLPDLKEQAACLERIIEERTAVLSSLESHVSASIDLHDANSKELEECRRFTRLLPELEMAEQNLAEWQQSLVSRAQDVAEEVKQLEDEGWREGTRLEMAVSGLRATVSALEFDIERFPPLVDESDKLRMSVLEETALLNKIDQLGDAILLGERTLAGLTARLESLSVKGSVAEELQAKEAHLARKIATFSLLQKACSNDGIIALELDDASPAIAGLVNDLLFSCYGSRFSIRMETQAEKVDGSMKETFDIVVIDSETGDERSITDCSGGQTSWLNDAITRGICLFNAERSGKRFETIFVDESDGALDAGKKLEFLAIKRRALELGSHTREFYITQSPELIDLADARIMLESGRVYTA